MSIDSRKILHFNITEHPTSQWTAQQLREAYTNWEMDEPERYAEDLIDRIAIPPMEQPKYLIRDKDGKYGKIFNKMVHCLGLKNKLSPPRSPNFNAIAERWFWGLRKECLNHMIVLNEGHLREIMKEYIRYFHRHRCH